MSTTRSIASKSSMSLRSSPQKSSTSKSASSKQNQIVPPFVRVSGPPNRNFVVGYPGISATLPRIEGKVEIRPGRGYSAAAKITYVNIGLYRKETIHPSAGSVVGSTLSAPRREYRELVGNEMQLFHCQSKKGHDEILYMDLPFVLFIPFPRKNDPTSPRVPPASVSLPSRVAETSYELEVSVQQGPSLNKKYQFPVPIQRYDTLSTFGMYSKEERAERMSDHLVTLGISLPQWSFGPFDPVMVVVRLTPNPDWMSKAKKVTIKALAVSIEEQVTYNPEGDEPTIKTHKLHQKKVAIGEKLPEVGWMQTLTMTFPARDLKDADGHIPRQDPRFPLCAVSGFTTNATLYRMDYFICVKATLSGCRDVTVRHPITVTPFDRHECKEVLEAIEQAARDAAKFTDMNNPMLPAPVIVRPTDPGGLHYLGFTYVGNAKKPLID